MNYLAATERFFQDAPGGAYRVAWDLAQLLLSAGHEVTLLCGSTDRDPPPGPATVEGVRVVRYRFPETWAANPLRSHLALAAARSAAAPLLAERRWDVLHAHAPTLALALFPKAPKPTRLVYTMHSPAVLEQQINWSNAGLTGQLKLLLGMPLLRRQERETLHRAHVVHVLSDYTRREVERLYGHLLASKIVRIPWWPNPGGVSVGKAEARRRLALPAGGKVLLSLRRMVPRMGLDLFLEAAEGLAAAFDFTLVLAGEGPQRAQLEAQAARGPLAARVRFPGRLSDDQVGWAYEACDAFVLPTRALECFGIIVVEAFARDRPVLGANVGAIPELLGAVLPEWLFEGNSVPALRTALERLLSGALAAPAPGVLERHAREQFGREKLGREYLALLGAPEAAAP